MYACVVCLRYAAFQLLLVVKFVLYSFGLGWLFFFGVVVVVVLICRFDCV